jgi:hypothetical protein
VVLSQNKVNLLDRDSYMYLRELATTNGTESIKESWFIKSHDVFLNHPIKDESDLIKLIAFAYSWMPTIPKINKVIDFSSMEILFQSLLNGDMGVRKDLLNLLVPVVNHSIVGTSKCCIFLHLILYP